MEIDHCGTAVARIKRCLDLDQATELSIAKLKRPIETGNMATADRMTHAERITDNERLASQVGHTARRSDWSHRSRCEA